MRIKNAIFAIISSFVFAACTSNEGVIQNEEPIGRIECVSAHDKQYKYLNNLFNSQMPDFSVGATPGGECIFPDGRKIYPVLLFNKEFLTNGRPEYSAEIIVIDSNDKILYLIPGASSDGGATMRPCEAQYIENERLHCIGGQSTDEEIIIDLK